MFKSINLYPDRLLSFRGDCIYSAFWKNADFEVLGVDVTILNISCVHIYRSGVRAF